MWRRGRLVLLLMGVQNIVHPAVLIKMPHFEVFTTFVRFMASHILQVHEQLQLAFSLVSNFGRNYICEKLEKKLHIEDVQSQLENVRSHQLHLFFMPRQYLNCNRILLLCYSITQLISCLLITASSRHYNQNELLQLLYCDYDGRINVYYLILNTKKAVDRSTFFYLQQR